MTDETLLRPATTVSGDERTWRSIADLEQTIGAPLLDRSRHGVEPSRLLKKGRLPLTLNCESDSYANKGMAGGIDARFGYADG